MKLTKAIVEINLEFAYQQMFAATRLLDAAEDEIKIWEDHAESLRKAERDSQGK